MNIDLKIPEQIFKETKYFLRRYYKKLGRCSLEELIRQAVFDIAAKGAEDFLDEVTVEDRVEGFSSEEEILYDTARCFIKSQFKS